MNLTTAGRPASLGTNLIDMILAPGVALRRISQHHPRSWWFPALLSLLAALLYLGVTLKPTVAEAARQMQIQLGALAPEQIEAARPMLERFSQPGMIFATGAVTLVLGLLIAWLLSIILLYFGASLAGAELRFAQLWPVVLWTWLPFAIRGLVQSGWSAVNASLVNYPGLSYLRATGDVLADQTNVLTAALGLVDLFAVWHVILIYLLLRHVGQIGRNTALFITILYILVNVGVRLIGPLVGGAFSMA